MQNSPLKKDVTFLLCDYSNDYHCRRFADLINHYMEDPMGGATPLTKRQQLYLLDGMQNHPTALVMFAAVSDEIVGLVTGFVNFSTFNVKKYLYVHDIVVQKEYRQYGVGRKLMEKCIDIAKEKGYCKVTLEVRDDNVKAKALYESLGFKDTDPKMHFWTKTL
jgi:ribosomal protein S18 acetylase RimI-like enzyme